MTRSWSSAAFMPAARSRVKVAIPQRRGGYVPRNAIRKSGSTLERSTVSSLGGVHQVARLAKSSSNPLRDGSPAYAFLLRPRGVLRKRWGVETVELGALSVVGATQRRLDGRSRHPIE